MQKIIQNRNEKVYERSIGAWVWMGWIKRSLVRRVGTKKMPCNLQGIKNKFDFAFSILKTSQALKHSRHRC